LRSDGSALHSLQLRRSPLAALAVAVALFVTVVGAQARADTFTVYTTEGRRTLPYRPGHDTEMVPIEQVARLFGFSLTEDSLAGGFVLRGRGQTILLIAGQALASVGPGRIVTLPAPFERQRNTWQVPVEFIRLVVGPALNLRVDLRRPSRVILVGDVYLPQIAGRFERQGANGRIVFDIQPAAPRRVTRQGNRITIQFDAVALDTTPVAGLVKDFATAVRVEGTSVHIDLGPSTHSYRAADVDATHLAIDLLAPPPPPPQQQAGQTEGAEPAPVNRPAIDMTPGRLRTVVLDPGHGGEDAGVTAADGTTEKDYVLQFARRLKSTIENRLGIRVILTREGDAAVPLDRRASIANNNKADLFVSLHANGSRRGGTAGVQVLSLRLSDYGSRAGAATSGDIPVAFVGGGTRQIDVLPWDLAQVGFTRPSAVIAGPCTSIWSSRRSPSSGDPRHSYPCGRSPVPQCRPFSSNSGF
jgi:N-acetylmuramoyl-L-alanine amidase